ncbi:MAG: HAMP domain-containing sensor histidine kinase [Deltaproteobacteria bacterium]|nr:HAMP domain-containing sensor histidine kinase [Deltaproteobacteria bacterium]
MPPVDRDDQGTERDQTDESLRVERERADDSLIEILAAIDETADAVITRARERADRVVAKARKDSDRKSRMPLPDAHLTRERLLEDESLLHERATADEALRVERAAQTALVGLERAETDRDLSSERARSDKALSTRDEFLGIVSHDLRNLLNGVVGFASLIEQGIAQKKEDATLLTYAQRIRRSGARMDRMIGDLVDVASIDAGALAVTQEVVDPTSVVQEAVETFAAQALARSITVRAEIELSQTQAAFDPARVLQVLTNLLSNAIKFTGANGSVVVRVATVGDELRFYVKDTGIGIPASQLAVVFERYKQIHQNDRRGVGLGLYISKCIVQGHGGRIWAESEEGQGSTFHFTLPAFAA